MTDCSYYTCRADDAGNYLELCYGFVNSAAVLDAPKAMAQLLRRHIEPARLTDKWLMRGIRQIKLSDQANSTR